MSNTIWTPQPKQKAFMRRPEYEALYGGAAGGGKSDALVIEALRQVHIPYYKCLIIRKTFPQLRELIDKSINYYPRIVPGCKYNSSAHEWRFPSGAKIIFGSMNRPQDKIQYQGLSFDAVFFDELTHFTYDEYMYLFSRNRPNGPGTRVYIRATANPGGIGHNWVKNRFITAAPPMTPVSEEVEWVQPDGAKGKAVQKRIFVPSTVFDNQALLGNDPMYLARLASMPEAEKKALLYGDWDSFSGQVFIEWKNDPEHYEDRLWTHVINPFRVPDGWQILCSLDWGYSRPFSVGWWAVDRDRRMYRIREYYGCTGEPNVGVLMEPSAVARKIKEIESEDPNLRGKKIVRVGDPAIWGSQGTESVGALMERERVYFEKGDNNRLSGLMQFHHRLAFDENGIPMMYIFNTCKHFIRTIPALVYDEKNVEDVDTDGEDHCLSGDTLVWTADGKKKIRDLVGTEGLAKSSDGKWHRYHDVRKTIENAKTFKVTLEDGTEITATANHKFKLADGTWKRLDELKDCDDIWTINAALKSMKVKKIEPSVAMDVYNMEVDDTHDFAIEDGIIVHNCYDETKYAMMRYTIAPRPKIEPKKKAFDPLSTDTPLDRYDIYKIY